MNKLLRILFPMWYLFFELEEDELHRISANNFELSQNENEYKKVMKILNNE